MSIHFRNDFVFEIRLLRQKSREDANGFEQLLRSAGIEFVLARRIALDAWCTMIPFMTKKAIR